MKKRRSTRLRRRRGFLNPQSYRRSTLAQGMEHLEPRIVLSVNTLSPAFDLIDLKELRADPLFSSIDGDGIGIAIIDSGIDGSHPDLVANHEFNIDFVYGQPGYLAGNHGTHVAGIAASSNSNIGVAHKAELSFI